MSYTPNIPQAGETLGGTRSRINANFQFLNTAFSADHTPLTTSNAGKHIFLHMPETTAASTVANEGGLYTKVGTSPAETNLFFRGESSGYEYPLTRVDSSNTSTFGNNGSYGSPPSGFTQTGGWTFLPGELILQYGTYGKTDNLGSSGTIQFPKTFPSAVYTVVICQQRTSSTRAYSVNAITTSSFTFISETSGSDAIKWMAIGK